MRHHALRHYASIVLLATYLPMVVLSSFHVHHETVDTHDGCRHCTGHFETVHHHDNDCQYCVFLGLHYLGRVFRQSKIILPVAKPSSVERTDIPEMPRCGVLRLRAPPVG